MKSKILRCPGSAVLDGVEVRYFRHPASRARADQYFTFHSRQPTFLAPEISYFNTIKDSTKKDFNVKPNDAHHLLRPETVESLWYLYYFSGNKTYQDWGWKIFQGIETYCKA